MRLAPVKATVLPVATTRWLLWFAAWVFSPLATAAAADRPNIVVLLCDDLGYGDLGCFGHPFIRTPHLDQLAGDGLLLTDCYSAAPICSPSRAGLLTGRTPSRFGIYSWIAHGDPVQLPATETTIATLLKSAGYDTCHVGKWHLNGGFGEPGHLRPSDHGFDHWFSTHNNAGPSHENPANFVRNGQRVGPLEGFSCQIVAREAITWLRGRDDPAQPFFLFVCFHEPHEPVASPQSLVETYRARLREANAFPQSDETALTDRATYYANVENMDAAAGEIVAALEELGVADNTLVWFTSDNGPETLNRYQTANRSYGSAAPLRGMKLHLYEGGIRVPGIVRWPAGIAAGGESAEPVASLDFLPTFCELAGVSPPNDRVYDGVSLLPLFKGEPITRSRPLFWHYLGGIGNRQVAVRDGRWKVVAGWDGPANMPAGASLRPGDVELLRQSSLTAFEFYDLETTPDESRPADNIPESARNALSQFPTQTYQELMRAAPAWEFKSP
jgi:arylsulfatase A